MQWMSRWWEVLIRYRKVRIRVIWLMKSSCSNAVSTEQPLYCQMFGSSSSLRTKMVYCSSVHRLH